MKAELYEFEGQSSRYRFIRTIDVPPDALEKAVAQQNPKVTECYQFRFKPDGGTEQIINTVNPSLFDHVQ